MIEFSPVIDFLLAWKWLQEFPEANFDDYGAETMEQFQETVEGRDIVTVLLNGIPVGIIGKEISNQNMMFRGICFSKEVHGKGIARASVHLLIENMFTDGVEKVSAMYFVDNRKVDALFKSLGAVQEGLLRNHTVRNGKPLDVKIVAIFKENLCHLAAC